MRRAKIRDLEESAKKGTNKLLEKFPYTKLTDEDVVVLFQTYGIPPAGANMKKKLEIVQTFITLTRSQFERLPSFYS